MPDLTVQERLEYLITNGLLPAEAVKQAKQVHARIGKPIRVVLLGMPGSGKTAVMNLLLGQDLVPDDIQRLPTIQVEAGTVSQMVCVLPDGSQKTIPGTDLLELDTIKPAFVTVQADFPALSKISLLDVVASGNVNEQRKAIAWACKRADIAIWCTTEFTATELDLWYDVPDQLKDHSYLLLTKTDLLAGQSEVNTRLANLAKSAGEEFLRILPLSAKHALSIRASKANLNMAAFKATGASGLIAVIMSQIDNNQRDARDHAEQMLAHYAGDIDFSTVEITPPAPEPVAAPEPASEPEPEAAPESDFTPEPKTTPEPVIPPVHVAEPEPVAEAESDDKPKEPETPPAEEIKEEAPVQIPVASYKDVLEQGLAEIDGCANELAEILENPDDWSVDKVLDVCEKTAKSLPEILGENSGPATKAINSAAYEIQDIITLMKSDSGEHNEDNAITLILQLRRDLDAALATLADE